MKEIDVNQESVNYKIYISNNFDGLNACFDEHKINDKLLIISDKKVWDHFGNEFESKILNKKLFNYIIPGGEKYKSLDTINAIYDKCIEFDFSRSSAIIALGGGVIGDIAGFAASTFMRGIRLVHVPTTIIADVDSSVGGNVGVNYKNIRNIIGAFYHPTLIYINTSTLKTLDRGQIISGVAEVIKYAVLFDREFFNYLGENMNGLLSLESDKLNYVIRKCIGYKLKAIENDMYDGRENQLLNFGHTVGHAIEVISKYSMHHGEAVALGMMFETALSRISNILPENDMLDIFKLIKKAGLGEYFDLNSNNSISEILKHDKKAERGNIRFIIPERIGHASIASGIKEEKIIDTIQLLNEYWR
jgi:3-dehydroquinate synthase